MFLFWDILALSIFFQILSPAHLLIYLVIIPEVSIFRILNLYMLYSFFMVDFVFYCCINSVFFLFTENIFNFYSIDVSFFWHNIFLIFLSLIMLFSIFSMFSSNPFYSVFFLILVFLCLFFFILLMGAEFLALLMFFIYVGAISILFMFVLMVVDVSILLTPLDKPNSYLLNMLYPYLVLATFLVMFFFWFFSVFNFMYLYPNNFGNHLYDKITIINLGDIYFDSFYYQNDVVSLGFIMFNYFFMHVFICFSILLLCMIGSISMVIHRTGSKLKKSSVFSQIKSAGFVVF